MLKEKFKIINYKRLSIFFIITLLFFIGLSTIQYSTDTYVVFNQPIKETLKVFCQSSRLVTAIFACIVYILRISRTTIYTISFLMAIIFLALSQYVLSLIIEKGLKNKSKILTILLSSLIIINPFSIELLFYIEKGVMALSVFSNVMALHYLIKYFKGTKKYIFYSMGFMLLANFSYQGTVALFIALSLVYIIKYTKDIKSFIGNNIAAALCYGIPAFISLLVSKVMFNNNRINGEKDWILSFKKIYNSMETMITNTYDILPKYLFLVLMVCAILVLVIYMLKEKKKVLLKLSSIIYILAGVIVVTILPQVMQNTASIWFVPRSTYAFASILGILLFYLYSNFNLNKVLDYILKTVMIVFLIIQLVRFGNIINDNYIVSYMDKNISAEIGRIINEYEKDTGNKISKIVFYNDDNTAYTYPDVWCSQDMNIKGLYPDWSRRAVIEEYTGREFEEGEINEELKTKFESQNWNSFNKEQVVCIDDTVHVCVY